jgi:hypothetical protein
MKSTRHALTMLWAMFSGQQKQLNASVGFPTSGRTIIKMD